MCARVCVRGVWGGGKAYRDVLYNPSFISGGDLNFEQVIDAKYDYGTPENHEHVNGYFNQEGNNVGLATGGDIEPVATQYQTFNYNEENSMPGPLVDFVERIGCLEAGSTAEEIDDCLTKELPSCAPTPSPAAPTAVPTATMPSPPTENGDDSNVEENIKGDSAAAGLVSSFNLINLILSAMTLIWLSS